MEYKLAETIEKEEVIIKEIEQKKKRKKKKRRHKTKIINEREMKVDIKLSRNERSNEIDRRSHKTIEKEEMNKI